MDDGSLAVSGAIATDLFAGQKTCDHGKL